MSTLAKKTSKKNRLETVYIGIPVFNSEEYLSSCLDSVFKQSYPSIMVICVNDGSTDKSGEILSRYRKDHLSSLIVIDTKNFGPSHARNTILDWVLDKSGFLLFLDSDDLIEPTYVERLVWTAQENEVDIVCSSFTLFDDSHQWRFNAMDSIFGTYPAIEAARLLVEDRTIQSHSHSKLFRISLWCNARFPIGINYMEDQATIFKTFIEAKSITVLEEYGYHYRQRPNSLCSSGNMNQKVVWALDGYKEALDYEYGSLSSSEKRILLDAASTAYANCFLTIYPRFNREESTPSQLKQLKDHIAYVSHNKIIWRLAPKGRKEWAKKWLYLLFPALYPHLHRGLTGRFRKKVI